MGQTGFAGRILDQGKDLVAALTLNRNRVAVVGVGCLQTDLFTGQGISQGQCDGGSSRGVIDEENKTGAGSRNRVAVDQGRGIDPELMKLRP